MVTQMSLELTFTTRSPVTARPTWPPTVATPGTAESRLPTSVVFAVIHWFEAPG